MPQISLYVDEKTLKQIENAAKSEKKSISKWVSAKLRSSLHNKWPEGYFNLFGNIKDDTFTEPEDLTENKNLKREHI